jgi:hypothetical protein
LHCDSNQKAGGPYESDSEKELKGDIEHRNRLLLSLQPQSDTL